MKEEKKIFELPEDYEPVDVSLDTLITLSKIGFKKLDIEIPTTPNEARFLIDNYYQIQKMRITAASQLRALSQGTDSKSKDQKKNDEKLSSLYFVYEQYVAMEQNAKNLLDVYCDSNPLSRWASKVCGIGPVLAASLPAYLSIHKEEDGSTKMHAGNWLSYCGLNDNDDGHPWLGREKSRRIVEDAIKEFGVLNDDAMVSICGKSKWKIDHFNNFKSKSGDTCFKINKKTGEKVWNKDEVISACSLIPYNKELKVVCYKIGTSFHKVCNNDKSMYGRLFKERLQYETEKNERGDYAAQAAKIISEKNFSNKETKAVYESGKLPISHLYARAERWTTKLFISHAFEEAYFIEYGVPAPAPYIVKYSDGAHTDVIAPEVPYER